MPKKAKELSPLAVSRPIRNRRKHVRAGDSIRGSARNEAERFAGCAGAVYDDAIDFLGDHCVQIAPDRLFQTAPRLFQGFARNNHLCAARVIRVQAALGGLESCRRANIGQLVSLPAKNRPSGRHGKRLLALRNLNAVHAKPGSNAIRENAVDNRANLFRVRSVRRYRFTRAGFHQRREGDRYPLVAARRAHFVHNLAGCTVQRFDWRKGRR